MVIIYESAITNKSMNQHSGVPKHNYMSDLSEWNSMEFTSHLEKDSCRHCYYIGPVVFFFFYLQ